jgi:hypothetical protein
MAQILHCDCCKASDGSINGNYKPPQSGLGPAAYEYAVPEYVKVWRSVTFHGHTFDICNLCLAKVEAIIDFKFNFQALKEKQKADTDGRKQAKSKPSNLECGKCHHDPHEPGDCDARICDAAGDTDYCPC